MAKPTLQAALEHSLREPESFWGQAAEAIHWYKRWDKVLDDTNKPFYRWFAGGELNTCYNALDLHVENGRGGQTALIYDAPSPTPLRRSPTVSYATRSPCLPVRLPAWVL